MPPPARHLPLTDPGLIDALGEDLRRAGYTTDGVLARIGEVAHRALGRGEYAAALRATRVAAPLGVLIRLFLLGTTEAETSIPAALPSIPIDRAVGQGLLERAPGGIRAALSGRIT